MKPFNFVIGLVGLMLASVSVAEEEAALILSSETGMTVVEFFSGNQRITSFDLTIPLTGAVDSANLAQCVSGLPSTHMGNCNIDAEGNFKLIVFSPSNAEIASGRVGKVRIPVENAAFEQTRVHAFSPDGAPAQFEFLSPRADGLIIGNGGGGHRDLKPRLEILR
ncbi:MAG: hypothetical protein KGY49_03765 [Wenzhouxiangellaceae bacterium]|nr:hypothetical protein [Wenzhouxiangellaceae bacterium]